MGMLPDAAVLHAVAISYGYGETEVLRAVDVGVARGEVVALVGPSGSGKSTLLYCLSGVLTPQSGSVWYGGADLVGAQESVRTGLRRRDFGFVLQFGRLIGDLTATENVSFPLRLNGMARREAEAFAREALVAVDLQDRMDRLTSTLSGGEQQRAAVARALIHDPRVVFADEPTGALDTRNGQMVMEALLSSARDKGAAVVLVTHDPSSAERADRQVQLLDGRVAA